MTEQMDVVSDDNHIIGQATQEEIYAKKLNHRIVHVFVVNPETRQVYFQKRAETKSFLPGYYCTSAGGHVKAGESYETAAARELKEELGLTTPVKKIHSFVFESDGHKRYVALFISLAKDGITFVDGEVASGEFLDMDEAMKLVARNEKIHPQLSACYHWFHTNKKRLIFSEMP